MRHLAWFCFALCIPAVALAVDVEPGRFSLRTRVEPNPVNFGEGFELVIELKRAENDRLSLPADIPATAAAPLAGPPRRRLGTPVNEVGGTASVHEEIRIPFLALDLDEVKTPALILRAPDGEAVEVAAMQVTVVVDNATEKDDAEANPALREAPPLFTYTVFDDRPLWALGLVVLALGLWWAGRRWWSRLRAWFERRVPHDSSAQAPPPPAHTIALERLEQLLSAGLLERGELAPFVSRLMDEVLRDYLERRYQVRAGTRTTAELLAGLLELDFHGLDLGETRRLLDDADLVKFARAEIAGDVARGMAGRVRSLILATRETSLPVDGAAS
ncbi:MAG: hypothetical protein ACO3JL_07070 [Myxococcota bacterium]